MSLRRLARRCVPLLAAAWMLGVPACGDDRVQLTRGPLGPAAYTVQLHVDGPPMAGGVEELTALLDVENQPDGATLQLWVGGDDPVLAELVRQPSGELVLDAVQGVPPMSAGEADLASLVSQLDPPLPVGPVRIGERWSSTQRIVTDTVDAVLTSELQLVTYRRIGGLDAAQIQGTVSGNLRASAPTGMFEGTVEGTTSIAWGLEPGRVAASRTDLAWTVPGVGTIDVRTEVAPR